ncbi:putative atp synthase f0 [Phaeomoniella chlamydospora]|uniref:Putative atp synthase f0 n=1 Tax=Phaeomoniella chlamydospora TaxID=158046 RepID=A0A0G2GSG0_PHACM|nr:putative atp synthase f0 [Phaeomoniella chlamydospora]
MAIKDYNPFAKRSEFNSKSLYAYKILTIITWLLVIIVGILHTFWAPDAGKGPHKHTIWGQNRHFRTPFGLNVLVTSIYWIVLLILQGVYIFHLWSANTEWVTSAANVGSHFIFNNLCIFGFIMCYVRGFFWPGELILIANLINQTFLYFRHSKTPRFIHIGAVSGPLTWSYVAIFWNGATMVHAHSLAARIVANVFVWSWLGFGLFYLAIFKDYTVGLEMAILSLSLALAQFATHIVALQWEFATAIAAVLLFLSLAVGIPGLFGKDVNFRHSQSVVSEDRERQPLLDDQ